MRAAPIHLSKTDVDAWRDTVLFGAYCPDPEAAPERAGPVEPLAGDALPPIDWRNPRRPRGFTGLGALLFIVTPSAVYAALTAVGLLGHG